MKKIFILLIFIGLYSTKNFAQNLPIAVNDTFYFDFFDNNTVLTFQRNQITANDTLGSGGGTQKIIDTISYNGVHQVNVVMHIAPTIRVNQIKITVPAGYIGKDSITYYLTDNGTPTGFDTALIYINVMRQPYQYIDLNNIRANVNSEGLFSDFANSIASFEVPKGTAANTIYMSNFWLLGLDNAGQLKGYAETFATLGKKSAGPLMNYNEYEIYSEKWDRVWKVSDAIIQNHLSNYTSTGYQPVEAIESWPAHGDTSKGQAYYLAPFVDVDFDGVYNPLLGDYPKIKGQQAIYFIRNDYRSYLQYQVVRAGFEFHGMVYAYDCPDDSAINNTIFLDYKIYNRSPFTYHDAYFGQWTDFDIGNSGDDYLGSDVARGIFYGYNGDANDEGANGVNGYGTYPPAQGVTFLKGPKQDDDGIDNPLTTNVPIALAQNGIPYAGLGIGYGDGIPDNECLGLSHFMSYNIGSIVNGNGDPTTSGDYYNYLQGKWLNGNSETCNGISANYMFGGNSDPLNWNTQGIVPSNFCSETISGNTPGDRRGVGSTGPFTLYPGSVVEIELAFVFGRDYQTTGTLAGITVMQERVDSIRSYHANGFANTVCGGAILGNKEVVKEENTLSIYPNPFNTQFIINYKLTNKTTVEVYNLLGSKVLTQQLTQNITVLDLVNQPNGIYFVKVSDGKEVITKKVIKQ